MQIGVISSLAVLRFRGNLNSNFFSRKRERRCKATGLRASTDVINFQSQTGQRRGYGSNRDARVKKKIRSTSSHEDGRENGVETSPFAGQRDRLFRSPSSTFYPRGLFTLGFHLCLTFALRRSTDTRIGACRTRKKLSVLAGRFFRAVPVLINP